MLPTLWRWAPVTDRRHDRGEAKYRGKDTRLATRLFECPSTLPSPFPRPSLFTPRSFTSLAWEFGWTVVRPSISCPPAVLWLGRAFVSTSGFRHFEHCVSSHTLSPTSTRVDMCATRFPVTMRMNVQRVWARVPLSAQLALLVRPGLARPCSEAISLFNGTVGTRYIVQAYDLLLHLFPSTLRRPTRPPE